MNTVKRYADWNGSKLDLSAFLQIGDVVDERMKMYFLEVLWPATWTSTLIQIGEPYSRVLHRPTYSTLHREDGHWVYRGHCWLGECAEPTQALLPCSR